MFGSTRDGCPRVESVPETVTAGWWKKKKKVPVWAGMTECLCLYDVN